MLKFTCCFDVERDILSYVKKQRRDDAKRAFPEDKLRVQVVGQEREMEVIYIWDDVSTLTSLKSPVTHVGIYTPSTQTHSTIFVHDKLLNIVSCSVNQDHNVLAYVALIKYSPTKRLQAAGKSTKLELFCAYLAEIKPQNRIFDLNVQRRNQLQVQFLWSKQSRDSTYNKECKLLFFLHQESIAMYNIPLGRVDNLGVVISSQPTICEIVKQFYWSQWDLSSQRLFFVSRKYSKSVDVEPYPVFKCYEYNDRNSNFIKMFEIKLDLPIPLEDTQQEYIVSGPCRTLSDKQFNMEVIQQSGGSLCVCYQHPIQKSDESRPRSVSGYPSVSLDNPSSAWEDDTDHDTCPEDDGLVVRSKSFDERQGSRELVDMKYSILVVHHGLVINAKIPAIARVVAKSTRLYFSSLDGYILVYAPGQLSHLVNVCPDINPCLHIALHGNKVPDTPIRNGPLASNSQDLTHFVRERTASLNGDCVYNNQSGKAFKVSICKEGLVQTFMDHTMLSQRLAIIHFLILHMKDPALTKRVMKVLCDDLSSLYIPQIFAEYLIGSTFNAVRRSMNKDAIKHLPFTSTEVLRGQNEHNGGRRIAVAFSYTKCPAVFDAYFYKADRRERRQSQIGVNVNLWESIYQVVQSLQKGRQKQQRRFDTTSLKAVLLYEEPTPTPKPERSNSVVYTPALTRSSIIQKVRLSARRALSPTLNRRSEVRNPSIFYDSEAATEEDKKANRLQQLMIKKLTYHFEQHLTSPYKRVNMRSLALEYIDCQMKQAKQLMELLWNSVSGVEGQQLRSTDISLQGPASDNDNQLYHLLERYYLATESVCFPFPPGFQTFFTCLGYRCLSYQSFLQYVERGVLQLTPEFVRKFFAELPDDEKHSGRKHDILIQLPQPEALEIIEDWKHPFALRYLAQQYVEETLKPDSCSEYPFYLNRETAIEHESGQASNTRPVNSDDEQEGITAAFPPLGTLLKLLQEKDPKVVVVNNGLNDQPSCFQMEPRKVEQVALLNTMKKYGNNLSDVTF